MSRVILLNLPIQYYIQKNFPSHNSYNPPLGLLSIGTWLEMNGIEAEVIDLCCERINTDQLLSRINQSNPILIGITVYTENVEMGLKMSRLLKKTFPNIKILLGGPHATLAYKDCISSPDVDFVSRKEGESSFLELAIAIESNQGRIKYEQIEGIVFKKDEQEVVNKLANPIEDLDLLPLLKRELAGPIKKAEMINIYSSRGCPGRCIYCAATAISGATYRVRDIRNVYMECVLLCKITKVELGQIYIVDDTFTAIRSRVSMFSYLIKKYNLSVKWSCESRVDVVTDDLLKIMSDAGCISIQYGIESGSQEVLDKIKKGISLDKAKEVIDSTYKHHMIPLLSFILGHYCDTKETMEQTVQFISEIANKYKAEIAVSYNTPFPGTWQYTHKDEIGLKLEAKSYSSLTLLNPVVSTDNFTLNDQRIAYGKVHDKLGYFSAIKSTVTNYVKGKE